MITAAVVKIVEIVVKCDNSGSSRKSRSSGNNVITAAVVEIVEVVVTV